MINISQIIRTRRKTIALIIKPDGSLIVRAPLRVPEKEILSLVEQKTSWIEKKQALVKSRGNRVEKKEYIDGETFFYLGKPYPLHIFDGARKPLIFLDGFYMNRSLTSKGQTCFRNWYRQQAASIITQRVEQYANLNGIASAIVLPCGAPGQVKPMVPQPLKTYSKLYSRAIIRILSFRFCPWPGQRRLLFSCSLMQRHLISHPVNFFRRSLQNMPSGLSMIWFGLSNRPRR